MILSNCRGRPSVPILLDNSAAFDNIGHTLLIDDLYEKGIFDCSHPS